MDSSTERLAAAACPMRVTTVTGFQQILPAPSAGGAEGMKRLARYPAAASPTTVTAISSGRDSSGSAAASAPPSMRPAGMATKVPICTRPLPPTSSDCLRCCGMMAYLIGPKKVDCAPVRNSTAITAHTEPDATASPPSSMMPISAILIRRARAALSPWSASSPAHAENRKKGSANSPAPRLASTSALAAPAPNTISTITALRYTLSLNAPSAWVKKKGENRRESSSENCPRSLVRLAIPSPPALIGHLSRDPERAMLTAGPTRRA